MNTTLRTAAAAVLLTLSTAACGALDSYPAPSDTATDTLTPGWETHYALKWSVDDRGGATRLEGYVMNRDGVPAEPVRLLAQALDANGAVVAQRIAVVQGGVGGFDRVYFDFGNVPPADRYRVTVWDYRSIQS